MLAAHLTRPSAEALRPATPDDADDLARFIVLAGEGLPLVFWSSLAKPGESVWTVGAARARRDAGSFSWRNAVMAMDGTDTVGCALFYPLPDMPEPVELADVHPLVRPLVLLEAQVPGHVYLNVLAVAQAQQGRGWGRRLLDAFGDAARAAGRPGAIIVRDENARAAALYARAGFREVARATIEKTRDWTCEGRDWVLLSNA